VPGGVARGSRASAVSVRRWRPTQGESCLAHVLTHEGEWIVGKATYNSMHRLARRIFLETERPIENGTSGGPVVDDDGRLLGVVSWSGENTGAIPLVIAALPASILDRLR
jgi:S1-C subfamily serine protease